MARREKVIFWGKCVVAVACMWAAAGCKRPDQSGKQPGVDILDVLRHLPDSLRDNPFWENRSARLDAATVEALIASEEHTTSEENPWQLEFLDSAHQHVRVGQYGVDDPVHYELLRLPGDRKVGYALVIQGLDDHCCSYARWALYQVKNGNLIDQTAQALPHPNWSDFFTADLLAGAELPTPTGNNYPFSIRIQSGAPKIELRVSADYLELNYPEEKVGPLLSHMPEDAKMLMWENGKFRWMQE